VRFLKNTLPLKSPFLRVIPKRSEGSASKVLAALAQKSRPSTELTRFGLGMTA
jgi:hypothetical protein